jgi:polysaccharide chain length determinant protein (PEP-CTERM system associated)
MTMPTKTLGLADYGRIARRRIPFILVPFFIVGFVAVSVVLYLPAVYRSTGKIAVESQQIPADLVRSTVPGNADERIGLIQQIIMTDARLTQLISDFQPYQEGRETLPVKLLLDRFRKSISIEAFHDPYSFSKSTIAFSVSFDHTDPVTAREVAAKLVELFLGENNRTRNVRASDTAKFLKEEADRLRQRARELDTRVAEFKREHRDALPEHLDMRVSMLQQVEFDLRSVQREISAAEQEMRFLETQRSSNDALLASRQGSSTSAMTPEQQLRVLRSDLAKSTAIYTNSHPDVVRLRRLAGNLEAQLLAQSKGVDEAAKGFGRDPERVEIEYRISTVDTKLSSLRSQESDLRAKMTALQSQILKTPETERGLKALTFEYDSAAKEFENIRSKQQEAELAESLESQQMAERFVLLEPPSVPVRPERPNRIKLIFLGLALALGAGGGAAFAAESLDKKVRDPQTLASLLEARPFAILPYVEQPREVRRRILFTWMAWLGFFALLGALGLLVRNYDETLQNILEQALNRIPH